MSSEPVGGTKGETPYGGVCRWQAASKALHHTQRLESHKLIFRGKGGVGLGNWKSQAMPPLRWRLLSVSSFLLNHRDYINYRGIEAKVTAVYSDLPRDVCNRDATCYQCISSLIPVYHQEELCFANNHIFSSA